MTFDLIEAARRGARAVDSDTMRAPHAGRCSRRMSPEHLRTFLAVQRHGSYTRAASELHLSQPAVWRQVRALETELGVVLIEPSGKRLHLTDAGRALARGAEALLGHLARLEESVR